MKSNGNNVMKVLKYIVVMTLLSYGTAALGVAVTGATLLLFELLGVFLAGFALPIIGILGIKKIGPPLIFLDGEIFAGALAFHQGVFPAAGLGASAAVAASARHHRRH